MENVASMTSRYRILLISDNPVWPLSMRCSIFSAFSWNSVVMKKAVEPMTALKAIMGLSRMECHTRTDSTMETIA
ncbi:MAG: hypothetical protein A2X46_11155 [Lentisphaerae bacterium GWF2_57_35]|nr:MAG: hypothetical protein A2X46_11155 [Lentisphaerae bacterium GWF2_57_35]